jgi:hypothetical protein
VPLPHHSEVVTDKSYNTVSVTFSSSRECVIERSFSMAFVRAALVSRE